MAPPNNRIILLTNTNRDKCDNYRVLSLPIEARENWNTYRPLLALTTST